MEKRELKEYPTTTFWKEEDDDIIFFKYAEKMDMRLDTAMEIVKSRLDYTKGKSVLACIDFSNVKSVSKEARDYMSTPDGGLKGILGGAFLSSNALSTFFVNLYFRVNKPKVPAKFFTSKQEAVDWLRQLKSEVNQQ